MATSEPVKTISAASAKRAASMFHYGNIVAALVPGFAILWFGLSMLVFAVNSHHPDPRVLDFNRRAARNFYPVMAFVLLIVGAGFGGLTEKLGITALLHKLGLDTLGHHLLGLDPNLMALLVAMWALLFVVLLPTSIVALLQIQRTEWHDIVRNTSVQE